MSVSQSAVGVPDYLAEEFGDGETSVELALPQEIVNLASSQGREVQVDPRMFLRLYFEAKGRAVSEDDLNMILTQYTVMPYTSDAAGSEGESASSSESFISRQGDGKKVTVVRKMNRNRKLQTLNMTGGLVHAANETKRFKDAAGLGDVTSPEKMNLEAGEVLPPLAFGSAHSVFFDFADDALNAMSAHVTMTSAMLARLNSNLEKAKALVAAQRIIAQVEAAALGSSASVPMTGALRALMNQNKMLLETYAVAVSSWLGGIYLPKITSCLLTANTSPVSRVKSQTLLSKLDELSATLEAGEDIDEKLMDEVDTAHADVYSELRRAGLTAALTKQMRGSFSSTQKREDHKHAKFVTASLREQLYYFISTGPMSIERRMTLKQFPLPRLLVAAERFLDADVCGTVDVFRAGIGNIDPLVPPDPLEGPSIFNSDQFDTGGSIQNITGKQIRPERTGSGVEEAEAALVAPQMTQLERHAALLAQACAELEEAEKSSVQLNITNKTRTNEDRAELRERATHRERVSETEAVDFVRLNNFVYVTDKAPAGVARTLRPMHASTSVLQGAKAPHPVDNVIQPRRATWMDYTSSLSNSSATIASMFAVPTVPFVSALQSAAGGGSSSSSSSSSASSEIDSGHVFSSALASAADSEALLVSDTTSTSDGSTAIVDAENVPTVVSDVGAKPFAPTLETEAETTPTHAETVSASETSVSSSDTAPIQNGFKKTKRGRRAVKFVSEEVSTPTAPPLVTESSSSSSSAADDGGSSSSSSAAAGSSSSSSSSAASSSAVEEQPDEDDARDVKRTKRAYRRRSSAPDASTPAPAAARGRCQLSESALRLIARRKNKWGGLLDESSLVPPTFDGDEEEVDEEALARKVEGLVPGLMSAIPNLPSVLPSLMSFLRKDTLKSFVQETDNLGSFLGVANAEPRDEAEGPALNDEDGEDL